MPSVHVNGIDLYSEVHGTGEPLLWIGGLGANTREISYLIEPYGRRYQFIVYDGRGCGRSDKPAEEYSIGGFAEDAAALLDALGVRDAFIYGSSMGGMIAQELALNHPERVRGLVLGCTTPGAVKGVRPSDATVRQIVANRALSGDAALEAGWRLGYSAAYIESHRDALFARSRHAAELAAPREAYMRQVIAAAKHDTYDRLQEITCPVLIIHGSEDLMIPSGNAHLLKRCIPHAELYILDGIGHGYNLEAQAEADAIVFDFLGRCSAGTATRVTADAAR
ncbi:MAG: alpha/beta fold hydrolase [Dehalococcoidia bacterium]|nr:alpha/beta fold hydrolase [Dehalococcoidia bacterium]